MPMLCIPEVDWAMRPRFCWITARIPKIGQVERIAADKDGILTRSIAKAATLPCTGVNAPTTHHPNKNLVQPKPPSRSCQCCHLSAAVAAETSRNGEALLSSPKAGCVRLEMPMSWFHLQTIYTFTVKKDPAPRCHMPSRNMKKTSPAGHGASSVSLDSLSWPVFKDNHKGSSGVKCSVLGKVVPGFQTTYPWHFAAFSRMEINATEIGVMVQLFGEIKCHPVSNCLTQTMPTQVLRARPKVVISRICPRRRLAQWNMLPLHTVHVVKDVNF